MLCAASILFAALTGITTNDTLHTMAQINALPESEFAGHRFKVRGLAVAHFYRGYFILKDSTGYFEIRSAGCHPPEDGDEISVTGRTELEKETLIPILTADNIISHGKSPLPKPQDMTIADILRSSNDYRFVRTHGIVFDAFPDEIDSKWNFLLIRDGSSTILAAMFDFGCSARPHLDSLIDSEVELTCFRTPSRSGRRMFTGPYLTLPDESYLHIIKPAPDNPFSLPRLENLVHTRPADIALMRRRTVEGEAIAIWGGRNVMIAEENGRTVRVELSTADELPSCGDHVEAVGFPQTDLYRINLTHGHLRTLGHGGIRESPPEDISALQLFRTEKGELTIGVHYHGRLIRLRGEIRSLPSNAMTDRLLHIESDGVLVPIEISSLPETADGLCIGCHIEVTGVCVMDVPNWQPNRIFPKIGNVLLIPRSAKDVRVLSRPPWWTPSRLFIVICSLFAAFTAILFWNFSLRKLAERRGRELYKTEIGKADAELRIDERTRLAVELHDSLAQNLTGAFFQIEAAELARQNDPSALGRCLQSAMSTLQSCREELRFCLWDLRNNALDESNTTDAIRRTILPHIGQATLTVDADFPRKRISDNTFHTVLRISRELASNAVRHGKATHIAVTGGIDGQTIQLCVTDDGCGFDPSSRPGPNEGHFGLQGILDRIKKTGGHMRISSQLGAGTRVEIVVTSESIRKS